MSIDKFKLKRCPFCGSKAEYEVENDSNSHTIITVGCEKGSCFCRFVEDQGLAPDEYCVEITLRDAIKEWNTRIEGNQNED